MEKKVRYHDGRARRKKDVKLCCKCCLAVRAAMLSHAVRDSRGSAMLCRSMYTHYTCKRQMGKGPPPFSIKPTTSTEVLSPRLWRHWFHKHNTADHQRKACPPHGQQKKRARPNTWLGTTHRLQVTGGVRVGYWFHPPPAAGLSTARTVGWGPVRTKNQQSAIPITWENQAR